MNSKLNKTLLSIKRLFEWSPKVEKYGKMISLGADYGSWTIPDNFLSKNSVVYLAGAGVDITFDVELAEKYSCEVHIFDPTPRAKDYFENLVSDINKGKNVPIDDSKKIFYKITKENLKKLNFHEIGLWNKKDELKFFAPKNPAHVSHSVVNLQKTDNFFVAKVDRLSNIMKNLQHQKIDLLKIDIEGAEYKVIESIIEDKLKIKVLCIEYDEAYNPLDDNYLERIKSSITSLLNYGYVVVDISLKHNYTLVLKEE